MSRNLVQIVYVSVVQVRIASNVDERRGRNPDSQWFQEFLEGDPFHGCECLERGIDGLKWRL